ncbi:MAG: urea transporter [Isosphaeraceae bacterium]
MTSATELDSRVRSLLGRDIPAPVLEVFRGIGQIFFQEHALSGMLILLGVAAGSPLVALGGLLGAAIGWGVARLLVFDRSEIEAGIYGFNASLVGMATFFFFRPGPVSIVLLAAGAAVATAATRLARRHVPFPTYTAPFIVTTWVLFLVGVGLGLARSDPGGVPEVGLFGSVAHGVSQVMFQASVVTAILFLAGIAVGDWRHAAWVLAGAVVGTLLGSYHGTVAARAIDPEVLVERGLFDNVALGLYGYNATLAAVALWLAKRSFIPPLLGMVLSVPLTDLVPMLGIPALTAPFVLATWIVLGLGWLDGRLAPRTTPPAAVADPGA